MKTLETDFKKYGNEYMQIMRDEYRAIYEYHFDFDSLMSPHYEVIRIKNMPERDVFGKKLEAGEYYPSSEEWGTNGFTCSTHDAALKKYMELKPIKK